MRCRSTKRDIGLFDAVFGRAQLAIAVAFLTDRIAAGAIPPPVSERGGNAKPIDEKVFSLPTAELCRNARSATPRQVAGAVRNATTLSYAESMHEERRMFTAALESPRSGAACGACA